MRKIILVLFIVNMAVMGRNIRIVTPYIGSINNQLAVENMDDMEDSALLGGLYFQWVNPLKYQWNVFLYSSRDINYSDIFDYF